MDKTYNKREVIRRVVNRLLDKKIVVGGNKEFYKRKYHLKYSQEIVENVLNAFMDDIVDIIEDGDSLCLVGYMSIGSKYHSETNSTNPFTGEKIVVPEKYRVKMSAGKKVKEACKRFSDRKLGANNVYDTESDTENES